VHVFKEKNKVQKTFIKSFTALLLALVLCLGVAQAVMSSNASVAYAYASNVNPAYLNEYSGAYYDNLNEKKEGLAFRAEVANLITTTHRTYTVYSGSDELALNNVWPKTDIDPNTGKMLWYYTGTQKDGFSGTSNREHVWPKDSGRAFPKQSGPGSDAHHLRPTDSQLNSTRGSLSFGEVSSSAKQAKEAGSPSGCYYNDSFFYPNAGYRGQTARILMYMQTRWGDQYNLKFVQGKGHCKTIGDIETLFKWHLEEPPTQQEIYRNNAVAAIQGNRNPFIDHPEYAAKIYCYDGESYNSALINVLQTVGDPYDNTNVEPLEALSFAQSSLTLPAGQHTSLSVIKTPARAKARLTWVSSNTAVATVDAGYVTAVSGGQTIITATDEETGISASMTLTVKAVTGITVTGTPTKLQYTEGEKFDPTGLTVNATYNDGTSSNVPLDGCLWLDATTNRSELSVGTTSVICKLGALTQMVDGITVIQAIVGDTETITIANFGKAGYSVQNWTSPTLSGTSYLYTSGDKMQYNSGKGCYFANSTPVPGGAMSITIKLDESRDTTWQLYVGDTPYKGATDTSGTDKGELDAKNGATWILDGTAQYFNLIYRGSGACYVNSIIIEFGDEAPVDPDDPTPPTPQSTVSLDKNSLFITAGDKAKVTATTSGTGTLTFASSNTGVATVSSDGTITAVASGTATITASFGEAKATCTVTVLDGGTAVDPDDPTSQFKAAVQHAKTAPHSELRSAIERALAEYRKLTTTQKADSDVTAQYAELQRLIDAYNADVAAQNNEMQHAIKTALSAFYGTSAGLAALALALYAFKRKFN